MSSTIHRASVQSVAVRGRALLAMVVVGAGCCLAAGCRGLVEVWPTGSGGESQATTGGTGASGGTSAGTETVTSSTTLTMTGTGSTTSTATGTGTPTGAVCDEGDCIDCVNSDCAMALCQAAFYACADNPDCVALNDCWNTCWADCGGIPDPATCHQNCIWTCNEQLPEGADDALAVYVCVVCQACPVDCSADSSGYCD
jgi:hypothetical protein